VNAEGVFSIKMHSLFAPAVLFLFIETVMPVSPKRLQSTTVSTVTNPKKQQQCAESAKTTLLVLKSVTSTTWLVNIAIAIRVGRAFQYGANMGDQSFFQV
jgi:hypothetical protein